MKIDEEKTAFNARSEAAMDEYLQSRSWVEKVESIERLNAFGKKARESMKNTLAKEARELKPGITPSE